MQPIEAIGKSLHNRSLVETATICGCYQCCKTFNPHEVTEWTFDDSAICPLCNMDSVIPNASEADLLMIKRFLFK